MYLSQSSQLSIRRVQKYVKLIPPYKTLHVSLTHFAETKNDKKFKRWKFPGNSSDTLKVRSSTKPRGKSISQQGNTFPHTIVRKRPLH